ncbi:MAG: hypothetical protein WAO55_00595 [Candidatus Manganitrophaceae bacterium]
MIKGVKGVKGWVILLGFAAIVVFFYLSKRPSTLQIPFASVIQRRADYRPPIEGVTLYPTEGPYGVGVIQSIAVGAGETLFVGTYGEGLFRSDDGGEHWIPSNAGLGDKFIVNLTPVSEGVLYAGTIRAGLFRSRDNWRHWVASNRGLENTDVESMVSLPGGVLYAGTGAGVFVSRDEGEHWEPFNEGLGSVSIRSIVAAKDGTLYVGTQGKGIFKRRPGESVWLQVIREFSLAGIEERVVRALVIGRKEILYAGTLGAGIFRSRDGGVHWERAEAGLSNLSIRSLSVDSNGVVYAGTGDGVFYSEDDGARWFPVERGVEGGMTDGQIQSFVIAESGDLYAGTGNGLFRGKIRSSWKPIHEGLLVAPIRALDYGGEGVTVGTDGKGVFYSARENWVSDNVGLVNLSVREMARGKSYLYLLTEEGLFRRQHGRHVWDIVEGPLSNRPLSIAVDGAEQVYLGTEGGLFESSDHGKSWVKVDAVPSEKVSVLTAAGEAVLAATGEALFLKSSEGWKKSVKKEGAYFGIVAWREGGRFLAATEEKLWEGDLQGNWKEMQGDLPTGLKIASLAVDPKDRTVIYLGSNRGLFWSNDGGIHWHPARLYQGERFERTINRILPAGNGSLWVATEEDGVVLGVDRIPHGGPFSRWLRKRLG